MTPAATRIDQRGAALIVLLALVGMAGAALAISIASSAENGGERQRKTALALGQARDALIARAVLDLNRPGSLPCPDGNNDGSGDTFVGIDCPTYVGRLPWKQLGLPDLRDGYGERLWYALSTNFRDLAAGGPLNSDTVGQLNVTGVAPFSGAAAIIFSSGNAVSGQVRDAPNINQVTAYLDGENADGDLDFSDALPTGAFNDQLLVITPEMVMMAVEQKVVREAMICLDRYAAVAGGGHYPWAAPMTDVAGLDDVAGTRFGRIPRTLDDTFSTLGGSSGAWQTSPRLFTPCFQTGSWWDFWRELLLYHVSAGYEPTAATLSCTGGCLTVNGVPDVKVVVLIAGRALTAAPDQSTRPTDKSNPAVYLELEAGSSVDNALGGGSGTYARAPKQAGATNFNDKLECLHETPGTWPCGT